MDGVVSLQGIRILAPMPALNSGLIRSAAPVLIVSGLILVVAALAPVRRAFARIADAAAEGARPRVIVVEGGVENAPPQVRREIEKFDLDVFLDP